MEKTMENPTSFLDEAQLRIDNKSLQASLMDTTNTLMETRDELLKSKRAYNKKSPVQSASKSIRDLLNMAHEAKSNPELIADVLTEHTVWLNDPANSDNPMRKFVSDHQTHFRRRFG